MYTIDIKVFTKHEKLMETLIKSMIIYSQDIGIKFSMHIMKIRKRETRDRIDIANQEIIKRERKRTCTWGYKIQTP